MDKRISEETQQQLVIVMLPQDVEGVLYGVSEVFLRRIVDVLLTE